MKFYWWLLSSFLGIFLLTSPAEAARLLFWRFDANRNQLSFTTDGNVQPKAQLIFNPTRLVIDLPGVTVGNPLRNQAVGGAIRSIRVAQFEYNITRLVVELNPGYTLDPQQVQFKGISPREWIVQLPPIQNTSGNPPLSPTPLPPVTPIPDQSQSAAVVQNLITTQDGFFLRTTGNSPEIVSFRSRDRNSITVDLRGANLSQLLRSQTFSVNKHGVSRIQFSQVQTSPPVARIVLQVDQNSPDWQASFSNLGGIVLLPGTPSANNPETPSNPPRQELATIESVQINNAGTQLLVQANQAITYNSNWDAASGSYRITIPGSRVATWVRRLITSTGGTIVSVRVNQQDAQTTTIFVQPAIGVEMGQLNQPSNNILQLELPRSNTATVPPDNGSRPLPPNNRPLPNEINRPRNGRFVVVVDPGHGGKDPGAIGIGNIQEKEIVLDIAQQVTNQLEQKGVQAILTRQDDREIDLAPRVQLADRVNATIFVSIHANAIDMTRPDISGLETYYYSESGKNLARIIHNNILQSTGIPDRRVRFANFYVLRRTSMPATLVEVGFVTGRDDAARLSNPTYRSQMAAAIVRGILEYLRL